MAEQKRREKMEANLKIKIKLCFEADLMRMTGFWDHDKIDSNYSLKVGRDQYVKELGQEVENQHGINPHHLVFFILHYRTNPRQVRFSFISPNSTFRSHIPHFNQPHFDTANPCLTVLCIASRGYDVNTLKWTPSNPSAKADELVDWNDDNSFIMLIAKYFCPKTQKLVTLGAYYIQSNAKLVQMVADGWVANRIQRYVGKEVAPIPPDGTYHWECYEEFNDLDIQQRGANQTGNHERLWSGDLIIWQPVLADSSPEQHGSPTKKEDTSLLYPVNNVMDYAAHVSNSIEAIVVLHDHKQPLIVDGAVANGQWTPARSNTTAPVTTKQGGQSPQGGDGPDEKRENPEDAALQLSPAKFKMPQEKEMTMDLRWNLHQVCATIARAYDLQANAESQLWIFHGAPSSSPEEPLNLHAGRSEQTTLKDVHRSVTYGTSASKKPLDLHCVELPFQADLQLLDRDVAPVVVRYFDDATREVGSTVLRLPRNGTIKDLLMNAAKDMKPEWGIDGSLRCLEVSDGRVYEIFRPDVAIRSLQCLTKGNIFYHSLRVEADTEGALRSQHDTQKLLDIFHCDRQSQQVFGAPFLMSAAPGEKAASLKARIKAKLRVPDAEFKSWRLVRAGRTQKAHIKDDEAWDNDPAAETRLCVEHSHPNPCGRLARQSRHNKPLTIR